MLLKTNNGMCSAHIQHPDPSGRKSDVIYCSVKKASLELVVLHSNQRRFDTPSLAM